MIPRYGMDTTRTHRGYGRDAGFTHKIEASDRIRYDTLPIYKYPCIIGGLCSAYSTNATYWDGIILLWLLLTFKHILTYKILMCSKFQVSIFSLVCYSFICQCWQLSPLCFVT